MQILFGATIRRLRREKGLTQEQLAARLNVSFQTISKWERDESYPDLSMLPVLAGFFGVRTDDLLGMDQAENERHIQALLDYFHNNESLRIGQMEAHKAALKQALKDFPNDYRLWALHFGLLCSLYHDTAESLRARLPEIRNTYEMILEGCTNDALRMDVKGTMCTFYNALVHKDFDGSAKEREVLLGIIDELPTLRDSREYTRTCIQGPNTDEEQIKHCHDAIKDTLEMLNSMVWNLGSAAEDERADMEYKRAMLAIYEAACPDGDYGEATGHVMMSWEMLAVKHAQTGDFDEAFDALHKVIALARRFDALPRVSTHTSPLFRGYVFDKGARPGWHSGKIMDGVHRFLNCEYGSYPAQPPWWPEAFKADPRFGEILSALPELPPNPLRYPKKEEKWVYP